MCILHSERQKGGPCSFLRKDQHQNQDQDQDQNQHQHHRNEEESSQKIKEILQQNVNKWNEDIYYVRLENGKTLWVRKHHVPRELLHQWRIENNNNNSSNNNKNNSNNDE
jgi:hypothetical protein